MEQIPPTTATQTSTVSSRRSLGIPTIAFLAAILLFLLPFAEIKCNGTALAKNTGLGIVIGKEWKTADEGFMGNNFPGDNKNGPTVTSQNKKQDPNIYAIIALASGIIGLILSFTNARAGLTGAMITGILSAGALIGLMFDLKKQIKTPDMNTGNDNSNFNMNMSISVDFTPWFYVAVLAFLVAAYFSYQRSRIVV